jgi:hypothetical protein
MSLTSNWGANTDGTGANPTSITGNNLTFYILNNVTSTPSNDAVWSLGSGSKIIVGDGTNATNFTIAHAISGTLDVANNATLTISDGSPTLGYYYKIVNGKFEKTVITDLKLESGKKLDSTYFKEMNLIKFPNFTKTKNAMIMYDFNNIKRTSIIYQVSCSDVAKPAFDKTTYTVCGTDSTIVKLTNFAKTDSTIWYVNGSIKTTNNDQLSFKNADTLYVKKIDGNGCIKSSDQIIIKKFSLPSTPTISRDTANNLVSSAAVRNTWFKDGTSITDTTQKIKPSGAGSFTVKTSENGCASLASSAYYYLVTDIINLSADEFIKLAPNPFQGQLNFDFNIKAYQKLNIDVFELTTGTKRASQQNVLPGSILSFGFLAPGTYIIKVSSSDQKLSHQFKMIKL